MSAPYNLTQDLLDVHLAAGHGQAPALYTDTGVWTYERLATHVAGWMAVLEARPRPPHPKAQPVTPVTTTRTVLLALADGADLVAALFASWRLGWTVALANPETPANTLSLLAKKTGANHVICERQAHGNPTKDVFSPDAVTVPSDRPLPAHRRRIRHLSDTCPLPNSRPTCAGPAYVFIRVNRGA